MLAQASGSAGSSAPSALHVPLADGPRAPTALEQRVVYCTLQLKDAFFAEHSEEEQTPAGLASPGADPSSPRAQRNAEDNVRGALQRTQKVSLLGDYSWALSSAFSSAAFLPGGSGGPLGAAVIGGNVPAGQSRLRKQFDLARYGRIKPAHMFSRKYGVSDNIDTGLLRYQHDPIHTSLTMLQDPNSRRLAVKSFRNILAFMGDRPLAKPIALAQEILEMGLAIPELRDEIFVQLAKQLNGNPSSASAERGWVLFHLALSSFPPSEELENHLELFLRDRGALPCVWAMHLTLYRQGAGIAGAPSVHEIEGALIRAQAPTLPALTFDMPADDYDEAEEEGYGIVSKGAASAYASSPTYASPRKATSAYVSSRGSFGKEAEMDPIDAKIAAISRSLAEM